MAVQYRVPTCCLGWQLRLLVVEGELLAIDERAREGDIDSQQYSAGARVDAGSSSRRAPSLRGRIRVRSASVTGRPRADRSIATSRISAPAAVLLSYSGLARFVIPAQV